MWIFGRCCRSSSKQGGAEGSRAEQWQQLLQRFSHSWARQRAANQAQQAARNPRLGIQQQKRPHAGGAGQDCSSGSRGHAWGRIFSSGAREPRHTPHRRQAEKVHTNKAGSGLGFLTLSLSFGEAQICITNLLSMSNP